MRRENSWILELMTAYPYGLNEVVKGLPKTPTVIEGLKSVGTRATSKTNRPATRNRRGQKKKELP